MAAEKIAASALYHEVAERLRALIFSHKLAPGAWIDEQRLALEYGISRTPLREALKVLAAEGLVTLRPRRGCYVTQLTDRDLDEIFPLLGLLEGRCAFEATGQASATDVQRFEALHADLEAAAASGDTECYFRSNQAFHEALQRLAGNLWAMQMITDLRKVLKLTRHQSLLREGRLGESLIEHRAIMAAIRNRDAGAAESLMREHLASGRRALASANPCPDEGAARLN